MDVVSRTQQSQKADPDVLLTTQSLSEGSEGSHVQQLLLEEPCVV